MNEKKWMVYLLRCSDKSLYCGISNDLNSRLIEHNSGKGARYTRSRRPVELVGIGPQMTKSDALKLEYRIKQLPADKKMAELKKGENGMTISKRDLQALNKDVKALQKKMEKLIAAAEKSQKPKSAKKTTAKPVKAKTTKRAPVKKARGKKRPVQTTAISQVLGIIDASKAGVDAATLMKETGFNDKKIRNILFKAHKDGKIKRVEKGIYAGV